MGLKGSGEQSEGDVRMGNRVIWGLSVKPIAEAPRAVSESMSNPVGVTGGRSFDMLLSLVRSFHTFNDSRASEDFNKNPILFHGGPPSRGL